LAVAAWWLAQQGLADKPWLETGPAGHVPDTGASSLPTAKIGLGVFLVVAGSLLVLLVSAYTMRMDMEDWRPLPWPRLLWANTGVLVLSSVALHRARAAARRDELDGVRSWLLVGGLAAVAFLVGQILAWKQLVAAGYRLATNPADAFFYLITAPTDCTCWAAWPPSGRTGAKLRRGARVWTTAPGRRAVRHVLAFPPGGMDRPVLPARVLAAFFWLYAICTGSLG
jgi:cytochrome c oxidase subunit 3